MNYYPCTLFQSSFSQKIISFHGLKCTKFYSQKRIIVFIFYFMCIIFKRYFKQQYKAPGWVRILIILIKLEQRQENHNLVNLPIYLVGTFPFKPSGFILTWYLPENLSNLYSNIIMELVFLERGVSIKSCFRSTVGFWIDN